MPSAAFAATWQKLDSEAGSGWRKLCLAAGSAGTWQKLDTCSSGALNLTIAGNTTNYNLKAAALATGWNGTTPITLTVTINAGVYVYSTSTGAYAFDTGSSFPAGSVLSLVNNGTILGCGGNGGNGGQGSYILPSGGTGGGPALVARTPIRITNNGTIAGGGGGGGGGGAG